MGNKTTNLKNAYGIRHVNMDSLVGYFEVLSLSRLFVDERKMEEFCSRQLHFESRF